MVISTLLFFQLSTYILQKNLEISIIHQWKIQQSDVIKRAFVDQMIDKRNKEKERIENCIHTRSWLRNLLKFDSWSKWRSSLMRKGQRTFIGEVGLFRIDKKSVLNSSSTFFVVCTTYNIERCMYIGQFKSSLIQIAIFN